MDSRAGQETVLSPAHRPTERNNKFYHPFLKFEIS